MTGRVLDGETISRRIAAGTSKAELAAEFGVSVKSVAKSLGSQEQHRQHTPEAELRAYWQTIIGPMKAALRADIMRDGA